MTAATVSYTGLLLGKGFNYTQRRGVVPNKISVRLVPQVASIAAVGDITIAYGAASLVVPDCLADASNVWLSENGFTGTIVFMDRRWRWSRYSAISRHWNKRDASGDIVAATQLGLRAIFLYLLTAIGESTANVSALPATYYPEIDAYCLRPDHLLDSLCKEYGFDICLGFGADVVKVVQIGSGTTLPTSNLMAVSEGLDPPTPPQYFQICFAPSVFQARFKCIARGLDTDGEWKELDDLSYMPSAGWEKEPLEMPNVLDQFGVTEHALALQTVRRVYSVDKFADDTLDLPDDSGTLSDISNIFPLLPTLLDTEVRNSTPHHPQPKLFGKYLKDVQPIPVLTDIGDEVDQPFYLNRNQGMLIFNDPIFYVDTGDVLPAELYLEAAFRIIDSTSNQFVSYVKNVEVDVNGAGYHMIRDLTNKGESVTAYDSVHVVTGFVINQTSLDTVASDLATAASGVYAFNEREVYWYNRPMFNIRLDGLITELQIVIDDSTGGEPGHYSIATRNIELDPYIPKSLNQSQNMFINYRQRDHLREEVSESRVAKGNN